MQPMTGPRPDPAPPSPAVAIPPSATGANALVVTQSKRPDTFVVVCIGDEVWVAQGAVMGTAERPHMQNRAYSHYTPLFRTQARDDLNDAYSIAQTLVVWLNLGVVAWVEAQKVPLVPTSQAAPLPTEQPDAPLSTDSAHAQALLSPHQREVLEAAGVDLSGPTEESRRLRNLRHADHSAAPQPDNNAPQETP